MPLRLVLFASLAGSLFPLPAGVAQDFTPPPPQVRPGWYARTQLLNDPPARDRAIMDRNLTAAERLITSTTGYAQPRGFEGRPHWASSPPTVPGGLRTYSAQVLVFVPAWGSSARNPYATIYFNPELGQVSDGAVKNETGEYYYYERPRSPAEYGTRFVYGKFGVPNSSLLVLFTAHDQDPMLPVSREEYLRATIHELDGGKSKVVQAAGTKTSYQQWMEGAEKRKAEREQMAEKTRATLEKNERDFTETLKKSEAQELENRRALAAFDPAARLRNQLTAMTPQERASQAWAGGTELMPEGAPGALRVVRANPAFFRARGSAADARAILVILREPSPALVAAQNLLHREFDWQALRKLLDTKQ